ncbi:MAG: polysaccharide deacetylase family protein [Lachnospiraceae bacterium]|nr:polysaccharide deacetylase family protein [Lachnospiraceae bacterium]
MTRAERRKQVMRNRISLGFIIAELILVCILIPIAVSRFSGKEKDSGETTVSEENSGALVSLEDGKNGINPGINEGSLNGTADGNDAVTNDENPSGNDGKGKGVVTDQKGEGTTADPDGEGKTDTQTGTDDLENTDNTTDATDPGKTTVSGPLGTVIAQADIKAAMYDYDAAIEMVKSSPDYETSIDAKAAVERYEAEKAKCVKWPDNTQISHIFVHSLIVDTSRAFGPKSSQPKGYNQYMTTVSEFNKMIESMYAKGYVLVSIHDIAKREIDADGNEKLVAQPIMLPPGKEPFVLSQDDVNYYEYMDNDGFADRLVIGDDGIPTCQYTDIDGNILYGEYDVLPIIDRFIKEHPDFSYRGAKGILAVTGYEGALGYDTGLSMKKYDGMSETEKMKLINEEREKAKAVAEAIKADGWEFASHSYTHSNMTNATLEKMQYDSKRWHDEVEIILGPTDVYIYPYGADICDWHGYKGEKFELLKSYGFWYFCNVDASRYWIQLRGDYFRMGRINTDGERMHITLKNRSDPSLPDRLSYFFNTEDVYDYSRPAWD